MKSFFVKKIQSLLAVISGIQYLISRFRIEEIDTATKKVVISRKGMQTILKVSLIDAVSDKSLIANLSADQACWLGYYCGKMCRDTVLENASLFSLDQDDHRKLEAKKGKYKILSQDRRGKINYFNLDTQKELSESPLQIINNQRLINEFDPSQACYIGILAGLLTPKQVTALAAKMDRIAPSLRLV